MNSELEGSWKVSGENKSRLGQFRAGLILVEFQLTEGKGEGDSSKRKKGGYDKGKLTNAM